MLNDCSDSWTPQPRALASDKATRPPPHPFCSTTPRHPPAPMTPTSALPSSSRCSRRSGNPWRREPLNPCRIRKARRFWTWDVEFSPYYLPRPCTRRHRGRSSPRNFMHALVLAVKRTSSRLVRPVLRATLRLPWDGFPSYVPWFECARGRKRAWHWPRCPDFWSSCTAGWGSPSWRGRFLCHIIRTAGHKTGEFSGQGTALGPLHFTMSLAGLAEQ